MGIDTDDKLVGLLVPVFAMRRADDLGIGDTKAVKETIDFCAANKIGLLQVLPINETGGDNSPYNAISSIALDPVLLTVSPDTVRWITGAQYQEIVSNRLSDRFSDQVQSGSIDYPLIKKLKLELLQRAFENFEKEEIANKTEAYSNFKQFQQENDDWLAGYSLFRTLVDKHDGNACFKDWQECLQTYDSAKLWLASCERADQIKRSCQFFAFVQWLAAQQWSDVRGYADSLSVKLMGDIPFGVSRYSADVWANHQLFELDWSGGAPAEGFFQGDLFTAQWGQNWGIPLFKWEAHHDSNFVWWRRRVKTVAKFFHFFRIDHVLGFFRIYAFPWSPERNQEFVNLKAGEAAALTAGRLPKYMPHEDYPEELGKANCAQGEKLLEMILEAAEDTGVVAEDLGTVPGYVRPLLQKLGIPGFSIPIFERLEPSRDYKPTETLPTLSLATYGTHDHQPLRFFYESLVAWWHGENGDAGWLEVQRLMKFLGLDTNNPPTQYTDELACAFFKALLASPCWLVVFMVTDLLGTKQRFNEPGLSSSDNWTERLDMPLALYECDNAYVNKIKCFKTYVEQSQRQTKGNIGERRAAKSCT